MSQDDLNKQLVTACLDGDLELVKNLIKSGADPSFRQGWALGWAKISGQEHIVDYIEKVKLKKKRLECLKKI